MVQIRRIFECASKYVVLIWMIGNILALPAAAAYNQEPDYVSKEIQKEDINTGIFGKVDPINKGYANSKNERVILLNEGLTNKSIINKENIPTKTEKPIVWIYIIWLLIIVLGLTLIKTNKKGVLFTVAAVMLSASLALLTYSYLDRNKDLQNTLTTSLVGENLNYITDDIIRNAYWDLLWLNLSSVERLDPFVTIKFDRAGQLSSLIDHQLLMDNYKSFIQTTYAGLSKINIELTDFYPKFMIIPFNSSYTINRTTMIFYSNSTSSLASIALTLAVDQIRDDELTNSTPSDTGSVIITVNAYDTAGLDLFQGSPKTVNLDPAQINSPYEVIFQSADFKVFFGAYNGNDGVLRVEVNNLAANITQLDITYASNETLTIKPEAKLNITKLDKFNKQTDVVLYEG